MEELPPLLAYFTMQGWGYEVVVVDDGSVESRSLETFCDTNGFVFIGQSHNKGKGAAVREGMLVATAPIRIFTDADIPFQYDVFRAILSTFDADTSESIVIGSRSGDGYFSKIGQLRSIGSRLFSMMVSIILGKRMGDTQCGIKAFRSHVIQDIFRKNILSGFATDIEWLYKAKRMNMVIATVEPQFRNSGKSSVVFWKQAIKMLKDVVYLRWYYLFKKIK
jgi:dolichyl-phosphate beta-glucosyltransferase